MSIEQEEVDRANEIVMEMRTLLDEFQSIARNGTNLTYERAKAYPIGHIDCALDHDGNYVNTYDITLQDIVNELQAEVEGYEDEDEDEIEDEHYDCPIHGLQDGLDCPRC